MLPALKMNKSVLSLRPLRILDQFPVALLDLAARNGIEGHIILVDLLKRGGELRFLVREGPVGILSGVHSVHELAVLIDHLRAYLPSHDIIPPEIFEGQL